MTVLAAASPLTMLPIAVKAVAIDLDGTLLHTAPDLAEAANRMLVELHRSVVAEQDVMAYVGNGAASLVKRLLTGTMDEEPEQVLFEQAMAVFFRHYADTLSMRTRAYEGVMEGLASLKAAGFQLACITNKPERFTLPLLKAMNMLEYFGIVVSGDSLPKRKPDPMPLLHVCERFGILPGDLLMIGDSAADTQAANAAGSPVFYVPYGYNRGLKAEELDVDAVVESLADVSRMIRYNI